MSQVILRWMREWVLFLSAMNILILAITYIYTSVVDKRVTVVLMDLVMITPAFALLFIYIYSIRSAPNKHLNKPCNKCLRAFLILIPTILLVSFSLLYLILHFWRRTITLDCKGEAGCVAIWIRAIAASILGSFVLIEIVMAIIWGQWRESIDMITHKTKLAAINYHLEQYPLVQRQQKQQQ